LDIKIEKDPTKIPHLKIFPAAESTLSTEELTDVGMYGQPEGKGSPNMFSVTLSSIDAGNHNGPFKVQIADVKHMSSTRLPVKRRFAACCTDCRKTYAPGSILLSVRGVASAVGAAIGQICGHVYQKLVIDHGGLRGRDLCPARQTAVLFR